MVMTSVPCGLDLVDKIFAFKRWNMTVVMMEINDTNYYSDGDDDLAYGDDDHDDGDDDLAHGDRLLRFSRLAHLACPQAVRFSMIHLMLKMILMTLS